VLRVPGDVPAERAAALARPDWLVEIDATAVIAD